MRYGRREMRGDGHDEACGVGQPHEIDPPRVLPMEYGQNRWSAAGRRIPYIVMGVAISALPGLTSLSLSICYKPLAVLNQIREPTLLLEDPWFIGFSVLILIGIVSVLMISVSAKLAVMGAGLSTIAQGSVLVFFTYVKVVIGPWGGSGQTASQRLISIAQFFEYAEPMSLVWSTLL